MGKLSLILIFLASPALATIYGTTVGEIRATATAGNVNGAFFDPVIAGANGVDYTQQDVYVSSSTAWASANGTSDPATVTLAGFTPSLALIGNTLHCSAGTSWTTSAVGNYHIILATDTTSGGIIVAGAVGSVATLTGGTCYIGGAASLNGGTQDLYFFRSATGLNGTGGTKIWWKAGNYTLGSALSTLSAGGTQAPVVVEGYNTTRGDHPTGSNRPFFSNPGITLAAQWEWKFTASTGSAAVNFTLGASDYILGNTIINNSNTAARNNIITATNIILEDNEFVDYRGIAVSMSNTVGVKVINNYFHDSDTGFKFSTTQAGVVAYGNLFSMIVSSAMVTGTAWTSSALINHNTIVGTPAQFGIGISWFTGSTFQGVENNVFYGLQTGMQSLDTQTAIWEDYNDYYDNGTDLVGIVKGPHDLAVNPQFANINYYHGTTATTTSGNHLVDTSATFQTWGITPGEDCVYVQSGTGVTVEIYGIKSVDSQTQITTDVTLTANATADKVWHINKVRDSTVGPQLRGNASPGLFGDGSTSWRDFGAIQHHDAPRAYAQ